MKKIVTFLTKNAKIPHPCPHSATMNSEFMAAVGGGGQGVFIDAGQRHR